MSSANLSETETLLPNPSSPTSNSSPLDDYEYEHDQPTQLKAFRNNVLACKTLTGIGVFACLLLDTYAVLDMSIMARAGTGDWRDEESLLNLRYGELASSCLGSMLMVRACLITVPVLTCSSAVSHSTSCHASNPHDTTLTLAR
jgi:hypothetical protein